MKTISASCALLVAILLAPAGVAAAQHPQPTHVFMVRNPGGDPTKRRVVFGEEERRSPTVIVGDPTVSGATLRISLAEGGQQCFHLPAFAWSRLAELGFKYQNHSGPEAVVIAVIKKEHFSGDLIWKLKLLGTKGPIDVVPESGNPSFAVDFKIGDGDEYCAGGSTPSGSTSTDAVYKVGDVPPPASCGVSPCSPGGAFLDGLDDGRQ